MYFCLEVHKMYLEIFSLFVFIHRRVLSFKYYLSPTYLHYNEVNSPEYHLQWGNKDEDKPFAIHERCKRERKKPRIKNIKGKSGIKTTRRAS